MSKTLYELYNLRDGPIIIQLSNRDKSVTGTLYNVHVNDKCDPQVIYAPTWMFAQLHICDNLSFALVGRYFCERIVLRPHHKTLLTIPDWNIKLASSLKYYSTLTRKARIPIVIDDQVMFITIEELNDNTHDTYFMENGRELDVEILKPLDMIEQPAPMTQSKSYLYRSPSSASKPEPGAFAGTGEKLGGVVDTTKSPRELIYQALSRRLDNQKLSEVKP